MSSFRNLKSVVGALIILAITLSSNSVARAESAEYESLSDLNKKVLFLGDVIKVDSDWCWSIKKPTQATAKKRLEAFIGGTWRSVGKTVFVKKYSCPNKNPYIQRFVWEVDVLGEKGADNVSGKLRLRDSASKPSIYAQTMVYESKEAYEEAEAQRVAGYADAFRCAVFGGEWNSAGDYCVYPPKG